MIEIEFLFCRKVFDVGCARVPRSSHIALRTVVYHDNLNIEKRDAEMPRRRWTAADRVWFSSAFEREILQGPLDECKISAAPNGAEGVY